MKILNKIITEICDKKNIKLNSFSKGWILHLQKDSINKYIIGYDFELNSSSVNLILKDKAATSDILKFNSIPHVEHRLFMTPNRSDFVGEQGNWNKMIEYANRHNYKLVCKFNYGSGGESVAKIENHLDLEKTVHQILNKENYICLSPFYEIEEEYRAICLNGKIKIVYKKQRPYVMGDGVEPLKKILVDNNIDLNKKILTSILENHLDLEKVYKKNERILLNWKHNLSQGSIPVIEKEDVIINKIDQLIKMVIKNIDIKFASFDIIKVKEEFMILEINAGIMMESFATQSEENYGIALKIYEEAIDQMFDDEF